MIMSYKEDGKELESVSSLKAFALKLFGECPECSGKLMNGTFEGNKVKAKCDHCGSIWQFTILMRKLK